MPPPIHTKIPDEQQEHLNRMNYALNKLCPSMLDVRWQFKWLVTCFSGGISPCINYVFDSVLRDCKYHAINQIEENLAYIFPNRSSYRYKLRIPHCIEDSCPDIDVKDARSSEIKASHIMHEKQRILNWLKKWVVPPEWTDYQEFLRFRKDDPREKLLFAVAESDHNDALNPSRIAHILAKLSLRFDIAYQEYNSPQALCFAIEESQKAGRLAHVIIEGHGSPQGITLYAGPCPHIAGKTCVDGIYKKELDGQLDLEKCFSGLEPNGKIILLSCSTGAAQDGNSFDNIAQEIADAAKRVVIAPAESAHPDYIDLLSEDDGVVYEDKNYFYSFNPFYNSNLFTAFRPRFKDCFPQVQSIKFHQREKDALQTIKENLASRFLIHENEPEDRALEYLQICRDDPRDKSLFLVADYDHNGALKPSFTSDMLGLFADRTDLQYRVVKSEDEICETIENAVKGGNVTTVVILSHGRPLDGKILSVENGKESILDGSGKAGKCLGKISSKGTVVLMGGSLGQNGDNINNIAQKIANISQRAVIATKCLIYPSYTYVQSLNPLIVEHEPHSWGHNFWTIGCSENTENLFKEFAPR